MSAPWEFRNPKLFARFFIKRAEAAVIGRGDANQTARRDNGATEVSVPQGGF